MYTLRKRRLILHSGSISPCFVKCLTVFLLLSFNLKMATTTSAIDLTGVINSHDPATLIKDGSRYYQFTTGDGIWYSYSDNLTHWTPGPSTVFNLAGSSDGKTQIRIFNSVGQTLKTGAFSGNKYDLKVSDIPSGMYIVKLENDSCTILKKIKKL